MTILLPSPSITPREWVDATLFLWPQGLDVPRMDGSDWRAWIDALALAVGGSIQVPDQAGFDTFTAWVAALRDANQGVL